MANFYWKEALDDDFMNSGAWLPAGVPMQFDSAYIAVAGTYTVSVGAGEAASVANLTVSDAGATLAVNAGGQLYVDDDLQTAGSIVLDNGLYRGASLLAHNLTCAGSLTVDAFDGSGGGYVYVDDQITLGGGLVVGNADLSANTVVSGGGVEGGGSLYGVDGISVTGSAEAGGPQAMVSFYIRGFYDGITLSSDDDIVSVRGNAEIGGLSLSSIGLRGQVLVDGVGATILGGINPTLNRGVIKVGDGAQLTMGDFENAGLISVTNGANLLLGSVVNSGTIFMENDSNVLSPDSRLSLINLTNSGQIDIGNNAGNLEFDVVSAFDNQGSFTLDDQSGDSGASTLVTFGSFQNSGRFQIGGGATVDTVRVNGDASANHNVMQVNANATLNASLVMSGTTILDVAGGAVAGAVVAQDSAAALVQAGTFNNVSTSLISGGEEIVSSGAVEGPSIAGGNLYLGEGVTLTSPVSFTPSGGSVSLFRSSLASLQVDGLSPQAQVDVFGVPYALGSPPPTLENNAHQHNVLQFTDAHGGLVDLQLDPAANYAGVKFIVQPFLDGVAISSKT